MGIRPSDILQVRKPYPYDSKEFVVLRTGMDFKTRCRGCGHEVMVPRLRCEKDIKKILCEETQDTL